MALTPAKLVFFGPLSFNIQGGIVTAGAFVTDSRYIILVPGTTDFTAIGAADSEIGTKFTASGAGSGTGTATELKHDGLNLKPEAVTLAYENKKGNMVFEDGNEEDWSEGLKLTVEILISELSTTDITAMETGTNLIITLDNGKVITILATNRIFVDVETGKTKIVAWKTVAIGGAVTDLFTIA